MAGDIVNPLWIGILDTINGFIAIFVSDERVQESTSQLHGNIQLPPSFKGPFPGAKDVKEVVDFWKCFLELKLFMAKEYQSKLLKKLNERLAPVAKTPHHGIFLISTSISKPKSAAPEDSTISVVKHRQHRWREDRTPSIPASCERPCPPFRGLTDSPSTKYWWLKCSQR